jgi:hypothetical protein
MLLNIEEILKKFMERNDYFIHSIGDFFFITFISPIEFP